MNEREELFAEKLQSQGWLSNEQAYDLRAKLKRAYLHYLRDEKRKEDWLADTFNGAIKGWIANGR